MGLIKSLKSLMPTLGGEQKTQSTWLLGRKAYSRLKGAAAIEAAFHKTPSFWAVADRVTSDLAAVPWYAHTKTGNTKRDDSPIQKSFLSDSTEKPPNPFMTAYEFRKLMFLYFLLTGEFFAIQWDDGLYPIPPSNVTVESLDGQDYSFTINTDKMVWKISAEEASENVIWMKQTNLSDPYGRGRGLGHALSNELDIEDFSSAYLANYLNNNASPRRIVHATGAGKNAIKKMKEYLQSNFGGPANAGRTMVTGDDESALQVVRLDDSPTDANLTELRMQVRTIIRETWGIPPSIMGDMSNSGGFENTRTEDYVYAKRFLVPKLRQMQSELMKINREFFGSSDLLSYKDPVPENKEFTKSLVKDHPAAFTVNEIRSLAGQPEREDGDIYLRNNQPVQAGPTVGGETETWMVNLEEAKSNEDETSEDVLVIDFREMS